MSISPWNWSVQLQSPDGTLTATIEDATEIAMGAPTSGQLQISNGIRLDDCNPSIVWSTDSRFLAVPQWTRKRKQRLIILAVEQGDWRYAPDEYRVLELDSFEDGIVHGVDSPAHMPEKLDVDVRKMEW